jgi:hypothetical protein
MKRLPDERAAAQAAPLGERIGDVAYLLSGRQYLASRADIHGAQGTFLRLRYLLLDLVLNEFFVLGAALAALGAWSLLRRDALDAALLATWLASALFLVWYAALFYDIAATYFLDGLWVVAVLAGVGVSALARRSSALALGAAALLVLLPIVRMKAPSPARSGWVAYTWARYPAEWNPWTIDRSWETYGRGVLAALPPRAVVLANWSEGMTLDYLRYAEGLRPDVDLVLTESARELASNRMRVNGRPCFTTLPSADAIGGVKVGTWVRGGLWTLQAPPGGR